MRSLDKALVVLCMVSIILSGSAIGMSILVILSDEDSGRQPSYTDDSPPSKVVINSFGINEDGDVYANWSAVSDDFGVDWYRIYINGTLEFVIPTWFGYRWDDATGEIYYNTTVLAEDSTLGLEGFFKTPLRDGTAYTVQVSAVDGAGNEGEKSDGVSITYDRSLFAPEKVQVRNVYIGRSYYLDREVLYVEWWPATDPNGDEVSYTVYVNDTTDYTWYFTLQTMADENGTEYMRAIALYLDDLTVPVEFRCNVVAVDVHDNWGEMSETFVVHFDP
ncbi:MAG: hypothetical protein KAW39_04615 [Thermoplasmata archaeon]|nr:hypothetical protein [Thermoplasmata archaeon]